MARLIRILSRRPGFRRAGLAHPAVAEYPAETFSAEQLAQLRAEPMLDVQEVGADEADTAAQGEADADEADTAAQGEADAAAEASASSGKRKGR